MSSIICALFTGAVAICICVANLYPKQTRFRLFKLCEKYYKFRLEHRYVNPDPCLDWVERRALENKLEKYRIYYEKVE